MSAGDLRDPRHPWFPELEKKQQGFPRSVRGAGEMGRAGEWDQATGRGRSGLSPALALLWPCWLGPGKPRWLLGAGGRRGWSHSQCSARRPQLGSLRTSGRGSETAPFPFLILLHGASRKATWASVDSFISHFHSLGVLPPCPGQDQALMTHASQGVSGEGGVGGGTAPTCN